MPIQKEESSETTKPTSTPQKKKEKGFKTADITCDDNDANHRFISVLHPYTVQPQKILNCSAQNDNILNVKYISWFVRKENEL